MQTESKDTRQEIVLSKELSWPLGLLIGMIALTAVINSILLIKINQLQTTSVQILSLLRPPHGLEIGESIPEFTLETIQGKYIESAQFSGKRLLLIFSSPTCRACQIFWPALKDFANRHPQLDILLISLGTREEILRVSEEQKFPFPVLIGNDKVFRDYKVPGTPYLYFISEDQTIRLSGFSERLVEVELQLPEQ